MANYTNYKYNGTDLSLTLKPYFKGDTITTNLKVKNQYFDNVDLGSIFQPRSRYGVANNTLSSLKYINGTDISTLFDAINVKYVTILWSVSVDTTSTSQRKLRINSTNNVDTINLTIKYLSKDLSNQYATIDPTQNYVIIDTQMDDVTIYCYILGDLIKTIDAKQKNDGGNVYTEAKTITLNTVCMYRYYLDIVGGGGGGGGGGTDPHSGDPQGAGGGGGGSGGLYQNSFNVTTATLNITNIGGGGNGGGGQYSGDYLKNGFDGDAGSSTKVTIGSTSYEATFGTGGKGGSKADGSTVNENETSYKGIGGTNGHDGNNGSRENNKAPGYIDEFNQTHGYGGLGGAGGAGFTYKEKIYGAGGKGGNGGWNWIGTDSGAGGAGVCYILIYYFEVTYK